MDRLIYLNSNDQNINCCSGEAYRDFIDYAFANSNFFMLVYVNYYGKGYTSIMKSFMKRLEPFKVKRRTNPSWPGTLWTVCKDTTYKIVFYRNDETAKDILKEVSCLSAWKSPTHPQDLAFFKGNQCWFYSVGHEGIAAIIHATDSDIEFLERYELAYGKDAKPVDSYYASYDEELVGV